MELPNLKVPMAERKQRLDTKHLKIDQSIRLRQQNVEMGQTTTFRRRKDIHLSHNPMFR
jgi:hypothetical protein